MSCRVYWRGRVRHDLDVFQFLAHELERPVNAIPAAVEEIDDKLGRTRPPSGNRVASRSGCWSFHH